MRAIVALVCLLVATSAARPAFREPLFGLKELVVPARVEGRRATQYVHYEPLPGKSLHFEYDVERVEGTIITLDDREEIEEIMCDDTTLYVGFTSAAAARAASSEWHAGALVAGGREWGCQHAGKEQPQISTIMRRVVSSRVAGQVIMVTTEHVGLHHFFKHAQLNFKSNVMPEGMHQTPAPQAEPELASQVASRKLMGGWLSDIGGFAQHVWNQAQDLGSETVKTVSTVVNTAVNLAQGSLQGSLTKELYSVQYNYNGATKTKAAGPVTLSAGVDCTACYANFGLSVTFTLDVVNYNLQSTSIYVDGTGEINVAATLHAEAKIDGNKEVLLTTFTGSPIPVTVFGIPVIIQLVMPVKAGFNYHAEASASIGATATAKFNMKMGVEYTGTLNLINERSFTFDGGINPFKVGVSATAQVYLLPTLVVNIDCLGGPNIAIKPFFELTSDFSNTNQCAKKNGGPSDMSLQGALNWGVQVAIGAGLRIGVGSEVIYQKDLAPETVYSTKRPLYQGCMKIGASEEEDVADDSYGYVSSWSYPVLLPVVAPANTWWAFLSNQDPLPQGCAPKVLPVCVAFQATNSINNTDGSESYVYMAAVNGFVARNGTVRNVTDMATCVAQGQYVLEWSTTDYGVHFRPTNFANASYSYCSSPGEQLRLEEHEGVFASDFQSITIAQWDECHQAVLLRQGNVTSHEEIEDLYNAYFTDLPKN